MDEKVVALLLLLLSASLTLVISVTIKTELDVERLQNTIANGRVYQHENFITEDQVQKLIDDIIRLREENVMTPSGLSNTLKKVDQKFGDQDRTTAPAPWWKDSLQLAAAKANNNNNSGDSSSTTTSSSNDDETCQEKAIDDEVLLSIIDKIHNLRLDVASILNRNTMLDPTLAHECYYSRSTVGAYLPRHMDERHEELKGTRGWLLSSRRSISWLIYLSDKDLVGGDLRTFPQRDFNSGKLAIMETGSDSGNLQIGWIDIMGENGELSTFPVYLDSWFTALSPETGMVDPHCILYTRPSNSNTNDVIEEVLYITKPWNNDLVQMSTSDFLKMQAAKPWNNNLVQMSTKSFLKAQVEDRSLESKKTLLFSTEDYAKRFRLLEDRESWSLGPPPGSIIQDIVAKRGSLVMFDSVSLSHEVLEVKNNTRAALAGWFHEETQEFQFDFVL